jgi:translocation and assembly module TamB
MRRRYRVLLWIAAGLVALPVVLVGLLYWVGNSALGRQWIEHSTARLSHGHVLLSGLGGSFPQQLTLRRLELRDPQGLWLAIDDVRLQWSPLQLLQRRVQVQSLQASSVDMARAPAYERSRTPSRTFHWPRTELDRLGIDRLTLGAPLTGAPVALQITGSGSWFSLQHLSLQLLAHRLDEVPSVYRASAQFDEHGLQAQLDLEENANGPLAHLAQVPDIGALSIHLQLAGPPHAVATTLAARAGGLSASARGTIDMIRRAASMQVALDAGAMTPRAGLTWQSLHLTGQWDGPITAPVTTAQLSAVGLQLPSLHLKAVAAQLRGQSGAVTLDGSADGLVLPGRFAGLLADSPVTVHAAMRLDQATHPLDFTLAHRLLNASGHWSGAAADGSGNLSANVTDIKPVAAIAALQLDGRGRVQAQLRSHASTWKLELSTVLDISGGHSAMSGLLAPRSTVTAALSFDARGIAIERSQLDSVHAHLTAHGSYGNGAMDLDWKLALPELTVLSPHLAGNAEAQGQLQGQLPRLSVMADLNGLLAVNGSKSGALRLKLRARDVPQRPIGNLQLDGSFDDSPLDLQASVLGAANGALVAKIDRAVWKSVHAQAELHVPADARAPIGQLDLGMDHLSDLNHLLGQQLQGSVDAHADFDTAVPGGRARVRIAAKDAGVPAQQLQSLSLTGDINGLTTQPVMALQLTTQGLIRGVPAHAQAQLQGPLSALVVRINAGSEGDVATQTQLTTTATLDSGHSDIKISALQLHYRGETARLLSPVVLDYAQGFAVDKLRLGVGQGELQVQGRLIPALDLNATLNDITPAILRPWLPNVDADGRLDGEATLRGSLAQPTGDVQLKARGLHGRSGAARALPAVQFDLQAQLRATVAQVQLDLSAADRVQVHASGQAPLDPATPMDLKVNGSVDLILFNPILEASGQRLQGEAKFAAEFGGTLAALRASGNLALTHGDVQDYPRGLHLSEVSATLTGDGDQVRMQEFTAHAGAGTLSASGTLGLTGQWPVNLKLDARNAQPLTSDLITANLDMNLTLTGQLRQKLDAAGHLHINHADLNIPNALPPSVAVLDVRRPGEHPAPEPSSSVPINLDLTVDAPRAVFVRGRGLNTEVGGSLRVGGTSDDPQISGGFDLRSGTINLAGTTLTFTSGRLSFNGTGVKKKIDPTLDFTATSTASGVTSTLNIGGYADSPVITLSSTPEMAQDEILSRLLFGVSVTQLTTLQIAQIATALATMSGIGGGGFNPINAVQRRLRLDRLAISGNTNGGAPAAGTTGAQGTNTGATIEAGRYVSSRVYIGGKQFTTGTTQAEVQIDLTKSLKVQTTLGTGGGTVQGVTPQNDPGSSIGLSYQFEY